MEVNLGAFNPKDGLNRGRSKFVEAIWYLFKVCFFLSPLPWPNTIKIFFLRVFGCQVGNGIVIKPRVNIHFPWKLELGNNVWLGEEVFILNFEQVRIGNNVCVSQRVFICGGNHDYRDYSFKYKNGPITIEDEAWVGAQSFVAPNVTIHRQCVVTAGSIVTTDLPELMVCSGNPCKPVKVRWKSK